MNAIQQSRTRTQRHAAGPEARSSRAVHASRWTCAGADLGMTCGDGFVPVDRDTRAP